MSRDKHTILDFYAGKSWAILEENLQEMYAIYRAQIERKSLDVEFNPEAVAAKTGKKLDNTHRVITRDGVALIPVSGPIFRYANLFTSISGATSIEVLATDFRQALDDPAVKSIVLEINSPGGEVDGTSELAQHIFDARGQKPITAYVSHLGASAAYWLASACDEIVCADTASVGSIGVVGTVCANKDKSHLEFVSSQSPNKRPNPETESGRAQIQQHIDDLAQIFIDTVARNRDMSAEDVIKRGGAGGLKVASKAVESGMADRVGTLESLIADLSNPGRQNVKKSSLLQTRSNEPTLKGVDSMKTTDEAANKTDAQPPVAQPPAATDKASEQNAAELDAMKKDSAEKERLLEEQKKANAEQAKQIETLQFSVSELQKQTRASHFEKLSTGWVGEQKQHLAMLETLSQMEGGEDSDLFKGYVIQQNATKEQLETSNLLKEVGSSQPAEGSAEAEWESKAKKLADDSNGKLTIEQARDQVWTANPDLQKRYRTEQRVN